MSDHRRRAARLPAGNRARSCNAERRVRLDEPKHIDPGQVQHEDRRDHQCRNERTDGARASGYALARSPSLFRIVTLFRLRTARKPPARFESRGTIAPFGFGRDIAQSLRRIAWRDLATLVPRHDNAQPQAHEHDHQDGAEILHGRFVKILDPTFSSKRPLTERSHSDHPSTTRKPNHLSRDSPPTR